ncbi:DUF3304 domain-containing protein [Pseudomonas aeruginosa]|nr:DUF3304 domain-containing protein [Pseudomonas aeruginosa]
MFKTACHLLLSALVAMALTGCKPADPPPPAKADADMKSLQVSVLNYTDHYIGVVYVDGSWASNAMAHSGGGKFAGSAEVPRQWDPNYKLTIHWRDEALYEKDPQALYKREVVPEPYQMDESGRMTFLWVAFFPGDVVKLYPTWVAPDHPDFPDGLLSPKMQCRKERPNTDWCEHSGWVKRDQAKRQAAQEAADNDH